MYPYKLFWGLDLYSLLIMVGVVICMIFIRLQADWRGFRASLQNLLLINTIAAVVLGYGAAVLLQAFYNYKKSGVFELVNSTGSTFYGGLIGGAAMFIIIYFAAGRLLFPDGYHVRHFREVSDLAAACITVAHGFGRLGCLMAGCCFGAPTSAWFGIEMVRLGYKVIPVQLFEAIFLFVLSAVFLWGFKRKQPYLLPYYMIMYAIWRFVAEYLRADDRGATIVDFLTPSQLISVLLLAGGLLLLGIEMYLDERRLKAGATEGVADDTAIDADIVTEESATDAEKTADESGLGEASDIHETTDSEGADA